MSHFQRRRSLSATVREAANQLSCLDPRASTKPQPFGYGKLKHLNDNQQDKYGFNEAAAFRLR